MSAGSRASRYPPPLPFRLCRIPWFLSPSRISSRNFGGICSSRARSAIRIGSSPPRWASASSALMAYLAFLESMSAEYSRVSDRTPTPLTSYHVQIQEFAAAHCEVPADRLDERGISQHTEDVFERAWSQPSGDRESTPNFAAEGRVEARRPRRRPSEPQPRDRTARKPGREHGVQRHTAVAQPYGEGAVGRIAEGGHLRAGRTPGQVRGIVRQRPRGMNGGQRAGGVHRE